VLDPGVLVLEKRYKTKPWSLFTIVEARKLVEEPGGERRDRFR
jgi:hypothetical protein